MTWDAPIHSVADILALEWAPRMINMKPSRFGPLSRLFATYDHLAANGIGRLRRRADRAGPRARADPVPGLAVPPRLPERHRRPRGYNEPSRRRSLPASPLPVAASPTGFRWGE